MPNPQSAPVDSGAAMCFLTLRTGERSYGLYAEDVTEVMRLPLMTHVPQSPPALLGIANLRGSVLPVASLRGLLGLEEEPLTPSTRAIVLDLGARVAVAVDAVEGLVSVAPERIEMRQAELGTQPGERLKGSFQTGADKRVVKILDIKTLLDEAFARRTRSARQTRRPGGTAVPEESDAKSARGEMLVTFEVAGQEFALDLDAVQEVLSAPTSLVAVPRADVQVLGVTSLRGTLLPLLSLRALLGFPPAPAGSAREKVVVMSVAGARVGLVADRARAIVSAEPALVDPVPPALAVRLGSESQIRAIYRAEEGRRLISILAPQQLFREDVMQRLNARGAKQDASTGDARRAREQERNFLVFRLGDDEFALPIQTVEEVAQVPAQITRVPKTPAFLEGVVNLRGSVLPIIDQRRRFDMPATEHPERRRLVVIRTEQHRAGLIVDSVSDVLRMPADAVEAAPDLTEGIARLVQGVINLEQAGRMVLLLDPRELLTRAERGLLEAFQAETAQASA